MEYTNASGREFSVCFLNCILILITKEMMGQPNGFFLLKIKMKPVIFSHS